MRRGETLRSPGPGPSFLPRALLGSQWTELDVPCRKSDRRPGLGFFSCGRKAGKGGPGSTGPCPSRPTKYLHWRLSLNEQLSATDQRALYSRTRALSAIFPRLLHPDLVIRAIFAIVPVVPLGPISRSRQIVRPLARTLALEVVLLPHSLMLAG